MNHSENPNISIKNVINNDNNIDTYIDFITNREIKKGEELLINYDNFNLYYYWCIVEKYLILFRQCNIIPIKFIYIFIIS